MIIPPKYTWMLGPVQAHVPIFRLHRDSKDVKVKKLPVQMMLQRHSYRSPYAPRSFGWKEQTKIVLQLGLRFFILDVVVCC